MKNWRKILFPFGGVYGGIVWLRNKFFDWEWLSSKAYDFPVICVGNLSVGGTGKTPMTEYLIALLKNDFEVATLSRGYKRKTKGFYLLKGDESVAQAGDEPLQFKTKFPEVQVGVDEDRQHGIAQLRQNKPQPQVIVLDDAFQHRKVKPGFSIVLTSFNALYKDDMMLPAGNLREPQSGIKRANMVVVTKCPPDLSSAKRSQIKKRLGLTEKQALFFTTIVYADAVVSANQKMPLKALPKQFCLVTGIARPKPLVNYLKEQGLWFKHRQFADHHNFTPKEIAELSREEFILTTEKDFMRLYQHLPADKLFYLPIKQVFLARKTKFDEAVLTFCKKAYQA